MAKTILIADDNPKIRELLCQVFELEEDYDICAEAANGQEAIYLALKHRPHLIVLDLSMPVMDGLTAAEKLGAMLPDVPIILFTQHADLGKHLASCHLRVERVVSKSELGELVAHVRSLIPV
jgi:CheY-like chemotaxis protein